MLRRWIPWKFLIQRTARSYGVIDPIDLLARLRRFAQPSETQELLELLRAGIVFHARGLINTRAIQHNPDWVWPYWVEKQFDPSDVAFMPRGVAISHVNLTHLNWTAGGQANLPLYPIVDPRGLVTPLLDSWSLDFWIVTADGRKLLPSQLDRIHQRLEVDPQPTVQTVDCQDGMHLAIDVAVENRQRIPQPITRVKGRSKTGGGELPPSWMKAVIKGADWIRKKRISSDLKILHAGISPEWLAGETDVGFGAALTPFGSVKIRIFRQDADHFLALDACWRGQPPPVTIQIPEFQNEALTDFARPVRLHPEAGAS